MKTNYPTKKLGEVCNPVKSVRPADVYADNFLYIDISSVNPGRKEITASRRLLVSEAPGRARQLVRAGDMVFATTRPYLENIAFITNELDGAIASTGFCVISPRTDVCDSQYLFLLISSREFIDKVLVHQKGASYPAVRDEDIFSLEIPLPPIGEQRKIVARLEELLGKITEAKRLRAEAQEAAQAILPAELHRIFTKPTTPHKQHPYKLENVRMSGKWEEKELGEICEHPQYGFTASSARDHVGPKFLRITDIQDGKVDWDAVPYCKCPDVEKYRLAKGDIVFARTGATVGKSFLIADAPRDAVYASYLIRLRAKSATVPEFLYYFFQSPEYWQQITHEQVGMAQPNVNGSKLAKIKILLPPVAEQKKIVARLDTLSDKIRILRQAQAKTANDFIALEQSVLHTAFNANV
ncbi:MAG: restriction endonuclease subunit S [Candidatus Sungbacteria bacterium]|nr:restriction endonuclease subunit S [Candidatus Sungbacteria bacterium]